MPRIAPLQGNERLLVVRLGAMGDILHALPAVESLKRAFPLMAIDWIVKPRWCPLLKGNPAIRRVIPFDREDGSVFVAARTLRDAGYDVALDLQGLLQSAMIARFSGAKRVVGYARGHCREALASLFYKDHVEPAHAHIAEKHLDILRALGVSAPELDCTLSLGEPEGELPADPFVLASPFAGWKSKQWPLDHYAELGRLLAGSLGTALVLNVAGADLPRVAALAHVHPHASSLDGLIHATRAAAAVLGVDSGPLHLAAALRKTGVALFGPTDPARNGPITGNFTVLRDAGAVTTYKREDVESEAMRRITPESVYHALRSQLSGGGQQHLSKDSNR